MFIIKDSFPREVNLQIKTYLQKNKNKIFLGGSFDGDGLNTTYDLVTNEKFGGLNIRNGSMTGKTY